MALWNDYGIPNWAVLLITLFVLLYLYINGKFQYWKKRGVKSSTLWDFVETIFYLFTKPMHEVIFYNYKKFGRLFGTYMGFQPQLMVGEPALLKLILVKDFHAFHNRMKMTLGDPLFDNMLTIIEDDDWKRVRCVMSPTFTSSRMRKMAYLVKESAEKFTKYCDKAADMNKEVDCKTFYIGYTIDIIASTAFGTKINSLDNPNHPFVQNARKFTAQDSFPFFPILMLFPTSVKYLKPISPLTEIFKYFKNFTMHVIEEREKNKVRVNDFIQLMLDAQRGKLETSEEDLTEGKEEQQIQILPDHKTITVDEMLAQSLVFFIAGGESTSTTLAFLSHYMALHPEYQERLIEEVDNAWESNEEMNFDVVSKMDYLDAVICEVLRIQPIAMDLVRTACEDYRLGDTGITIEKGTIVFVPVYGMHHDPEFFPDPETFDPERFMPENRHSIPPYAYLPFGEGPRNCIGMRFTMMVLKLCVVYLFRTLRMEATENTKKPLEYLRGQGLIQPKRVMVRMKKRKDVLK